MTITLAPGYVLSRSKEKINVTITDGLFKEGIAKVGLLVWQCHYCCSKSHAEKTYHVFTSLSILLALL